MTIENMIKSCAKLTPTENLLAGFIVKNKERIEKLTIQQFAEEAYVSISAVHRFCKKIGLNGFNELKVKAAQDSVNKGKDEKQIDVNFPFMFGDSYTTIAQQIKSLYEASIEDTYNSLDKNELSKCVGLLYNAEIIDIYTHAHNINIAENFKDKMRAIGRMVNCPNSFYDQRCTAVTADNKKHVAVILSYSGKASFLPTIIEILNKKEIEVIWIGRLGNDMTEGFIKHNLYISGKENLRNRISQFSSHIAMQYVLDIIFSCIFNIDYSKNINYINEISKIVDDRDLDRE